MRQMGTLGTQGGEGGREGGALSEDRVSGEELGMQESAHELHPAPPPMPHTPASGHSPQQHLSVPSPPPTMPCLGERGEVGW